MLAIIRSALMSSGANHVSLLFTGSIRNALKMMLEDSDQPLFGEAGQMQLPVIDRVDFIEYLNYQFQATGNGADDQALGHLLNLTRAYPRSTQQLAWEAWSDTPAGKPVTLGCVMNAHDRGKPDFMLFGVGPYTLAPFKVAVSGFYKRPCFTLLCPDEHGRPPIVDDTC